MSIDEMSIDEMIIELWTNPDISDKAIARIVNLLRAGQDMYRAPWGQGDALSCYEYGHNKWSDITGVPRIYKGEEEV